MPETNVAIDVGYATAVFERRPGDLSRGIGAVITGTAPQSTRYAAVLGAEGNRWIITLAGCLRDYPPTDLEGWRAFAGALPTGPIVSYRFRANRHRHHEKLKDLPAGYIVTGDAVCSFNRSTGKACR